jgi:glycine/D-amino acid oxidase-like deaminating enzyme
MSIALSRSSGNLNLQTHTRVAAITESEHNGMRWELSTSRGQIHAKSVLHATNGHLMSLLPELAETPQQVSPVKDMIASFRPKPSPSSRGTWPLNVLVSNAMHYAIQLPSLPDKENVVIYGLYYEFNSPDDSKLLDDTNGALAHQRAVLPLLFPEKFSEYDGEGRIPEENVERVWTGVCGHTTDWSVMIGPVKGKKGQFMSAGYNGAGMAKCWLSAKCVVDMILWELNKEKKKEWQIPEWCPEHFCKNLEEL